MVVEAGHLQHFSHGQPHLGSQGHQIALGQAVEMVVELVQVLDQQVAPVAFKRHISDECAHGLHGIGFRLAPLELEAGFVPHHMDRLNGLVFHGCKPVGSGAGRKAGPDGVQ